MLFKKKTRKVNMSLIEKLGDIYRYITPFLLFYIIMSPILHFWDLVFWE